MTDRSQTELFSFKGNVFLGGCPKSGTTLFLSLLDGHPDLLVFPVELDLFHKVIPKAGDRDWKRMSEYCLTRTHLALLAAKTPPSETAKPEERVDFSKFDWPLFKKRFLSKRIDGENLPQTLLGNIVDAYAKTVKPAPAPGEYWIVEKTPANDYNADRIFQYFPNAKILQIIRDPRAVYASRRSRLIQGGRRHTKAFRLIREWNRSVWQQYRLAEKEQNFLNFRYEDLVSKPQVLMEKVCRFIGISASSLHLEPTRSGVAWVGNSSYGELFAGISRAPMDRWRTELSEKEIWWIEFHCHRRMKDLGYEVKNDFAGFWKNLWRWLQPIDHESFLGYLRARRGSLWFHLLPRFYPVVRGVFSKTDAFLSNSIWLYAGLCSQT